MLLLLMAGHSWVLLSLLCCTSVHLAVGDGDFDHLMLVREWPFSFCSVSDCKNEELLQPKFNIHGLWAESADGASENREPMFCNVTFQIEELAPLTDELQANWLDLTNPNGSGKKFWRSEFVKHGSCVATDARYNSTYRYFRAALSLHEKYNLSEMLATSGGIQPGADAIDATDIRQALQKAFGYRPGVRCSKKDDITYLYELRLCFTPDLEPMDCSETPESPQKQLKQFEQAELTVQVEQQLLELQLKPEEPWLDGKHAELLKFEAWELALELRPRPQAANQGTYECHDGELVLMPLSPGAA